MREEPKPNSYYAGDVVVAKATPDRLLIIRRYVDRVYYCRIKDDPAGANGSEYVYYERELIQPSKNL